MSIKTVIMQDYVRGGAKGVHKLKLQGIAFFSGDRGPSRHQNEIESVKCDQVM